MSSYAFRKCNLPFSWRQHVRSRCTTAFALTQPSSPGMRPPFKGFSKVPNENKSKQAVKNMQDLVIGFQKGDLDAKQLLSSRQNMMTSSVLTSQSSAVPGNKHVFEDTVKFPTDFMIKIVGLNEPNFVCDILGVVRKGLGPNNSDQLQHSIKETAGGKYVSVSVTPYFESKEELYAVYERVRQDGRVKFML